MWRAQVLPAVHGSRLMGILDGSLVQPSPLIHVKKADQSEEEVENPAHITWIAQDQQLLAYLLSSMTSEILVQVSSHEHVAQLWMAVNEMFASQSRSKLLQLRSQLSREKKGDASTVVYYSKMKAIADRWQLLARS